MITKTRMIYEQEVVLARLTWSELSRERDVGG